MNLTSIVAGETTDMSLRFVTSNAVPADGMIIVELPRTFPGLGEWDTSSDDSTKLMIGDSEFDTSHFDVQALGRNITISGFETTVGSIPNGTDILIVLKVTCCQGQWFERCPWCNLNWSRVRDVVLRCNRAHHIFFSFWTPGKWGGASWSADDISPLFQNITPWRLREIIQLQSYNSFSPTSGHQKSQHVFEDWSGTFPGNRGQFQRLD